MFAPNSSSAGGFETPGTQNNDVVLCERSPYPLALPGALIITLFDQVNEGIRSVPRGGAEVGGLVLGRKSQSGIVLAEDLIPIATEYRFGPSFRLSPADLENLEQLMASIQKDPSKAVVGFYRSRTRNDSQSQASDSELLEILERTHYSFSSDFHYYVAFTPLSKLSLTASVSLRKPTGWDQWQHFTLRFPLGGMSVLEPVEMQPRVVPKPAPRELAPTLQPPETFDSHPAPAPPVPAPVEPMPYSRRHPEPPVQPEVPAVVQPPRVAEPERPPAVSERVPFTTPASQRRQNALRPKVTWLIAAAVVAGAVTVGAYLRPKPALNFAEIASARVAAPAPTSGFSAAKEGPLWKLTWDRSAVEAMNPTGAVLSIRDGGKEQQIGLTSSDISSGTIFYTPQSNDLLFSFNLILPGNVVAEEHVRVLDAPHEADTPAASSAPLVVRDAVRTLRPFDPSKVLPGTSPANNLAENQIPSPPVLPSATAGQPLNLPAPAGPAPVSSTPAGGNREVAVSAVPVVPAPTPAVSGSKPTNYVGPKVLKQVGLAVSNPRAAGAAGDIQVRVQIDAKGAVIKAAAVNSSPATFQLADEAVRSVRYWSFQPAQQDGRPVPSEMVLNFHFDNR